METKEKSGPAVGQVFIKEFYIVGVVPKLLPKGFFICGDHGPATSSSQEDGLYPCIGSDRQAAEEQYAKALETYANMPELGTVVMFKFTGGVIEKMQEFATKDQATIQA
jgi:hypothetical protein